MDHCNVNHIFSYSVAVSIEKDKNLTPAHSLKSTRASHSAQDIQ